MQRTSAVIFALILLVSGRASAQEWTEYQNNQEGFKIDFPGQPKVTDIVWQTQFDYKLPAHVYSAEKGRERYSVTVIDYRPIEQMGIERRKGCPAGAEPCIGSDLSGPGFWRHDVRGALIYAAFKFVERPAKVTHMLWSHEDLVEGIQLQLTNNADQSLTYAYISMHDMKLYINEGTVPKGYPPPALFQQSMGYVDKDGNGIRYNTIYSNEIYALGDAPTPAHGGGGAGGGAGRGGRGGGGQGGGGRRGGGAGNANPQ